MKISFAQYRTFLKILVSILLVIDILYGLVLGSSTSLIRSVGHIAIIILLMINHRDIRFVVNLWALVLLILIPLIYPGIAAMYFLSDNVTAIDTRKLMIKLGWVLLGLGILVINNSKKIVYVE